MTFDPISVEVTCVTVPKDHCVQVPWEYINVCGYSDQFCKLPHTYIHIHTCYVHTTYRMSDLIVSYWTQFRRDKKHVVQKTQCLLINLYKNCVEKKSKYGTAYHHNPAHRTLCCKKHVESISLPTNSHFENQYWFSEMVNIKSFSKLWSPEKKIACVEVKLFENLQRWIEHVNSRSSTLTQLWQ